MKGWGEGQGLSDLEVKVTSTLSIMCDRDAEYSSHPRVIWV